MNDEGKLYEIILKETTGRRDLYIGDWIRAISKGIEQYVNDEIVKLKQDILNEVINGNKTHN